MTLVVGLGNPGPKYENNRHNIGFKIIDLLVDEYSASNISNKKFKGELFKYRNQLFLKPDTFMNLSGESVSAVCSFYDVDEVIVIHDDLDLTLGSLKYKIGGSSGGHNGLKSIDSHIGSEYIRIRFGIGKPERKGEVSSFVLSDFSKEEWEYIQESIDIAIKVIKELQNNHIDYIKQNFSLKRNNI